MFPGFASFIYLFLKYLCIYLFHCAGSGMARWILDPHCKVLVAARGV